MPLSLVPEAVCMRRNLIPSSSPLLSMRSIYISPNSLLTLTHRHWLRFLRAAPQGGLLRHPRRPCPPPRVRGPPRQVPPPAQRGGRRIGRLAPDGPVRLGSDFGDVGFCPRNVSAGRSAVSGSRHLVSLYHYSHHYCYADMKFSATYGVQKS